MAVLEKRKNNVNVGEMNLDSRLLEMIVANAVRIAEDNKGSENTAIIGFDELENLVKEKSKSREFKQYTIDELAGLYDDFAEKVKIINSMTDDKYDSDDSKDCYNDYDKARDNNGSILNEGVLKDDLQLNDSFLIEKGTSFRKIADLGADNILVYFSEHSVVYRGIKYKNASIEIPVDKGIYCSFAKKDNYLTSLDELSLEDIHADECSIKGTDLMIISGSELIGNIVDKYNIYSKDKVSIEDVTSGMYDINFDIIDMAMTRLGFKIFGHRDKLYIK